MISKFVKKNTLVFTFGAVGSGKSTVLAGIFNKIKRDNFVIEFNKKDNVSKKIFDNYKNYIENNKLPDATSVIETTGGDVLSCNISIKKDKIGSSNFTFYELAGEDLETIYPHFADILQEFYSKRKAKETEIKREKTEAVKFGNKLDNVLTSNKPTIFILVASFETASLEDELINTFISYIRANKSAKHIKGVMLVVSMWDLNFVENKPKYTGLLDFVEEEMPMTFAQLQFFNKKEIPADGFSFSIGSVDGQNIIKPDYSYSYKLLNWLIQIHKK